jgi:tricorn protease
MRSWTVRFSSLLFLVSLFPAQASPPLLLQKPTLSRDQVVFVYAGDLWIVGRNGGDAARLTTGVGVETDPHFSPDGSLVAFTGEYEGNTDVYVIPTTGGVPRRLTYHPASDRAIGWTPDGQRILFSSPRNSPFYNNRLFTVPREGGFPTELPLPVAEEGAFSADGTRLAYVPTLQWQDAWKRYRGGQTKPVWGSRPFRLEHRESSPRKLQRF